MFQIEILKINIDLSATFVLMASIYSGIICSNSCASIDSTLNPVYSTWITYFTSYLRKIK